MKAIMISIKPKWCAKIMNGEKTIEVRKNKALANAIQKLIDENGYADIYVYCTKDKSLIYTDGTDGKGDYVDYKYYDSYKGDENDIGGGKVVFKFRCHEAREISWQIGLHELEQQSFSNFLDKCCLSYFELNDYLNMENGYAIHISDLEIFDEPKELSEFKRKKAPQNFCYVEYQNELDIKRRCCYEF